MKRYTHFIAGAFTPEAEEAIESIDPASGQTWASFSRGTASDGDHAMSAADRAFRKGVWTQARPEDRAAMLDRVADHLSSHWEALVEPEIRDNGKRIVEVRAQLSDLHKWYRHFAAQARALRTEQLSGSIAGVEAATHFVPYGVVVAVTPWNSPLMILTWKRESSNTSALPGERFIGAMRVGVQFVRQSERMRTVLLKVFLFFMQSAAVLALLPLIARQMPGGSASTYTVLLASMGAGAIASAGLIPRLRKRFPSETLVRVGSLLQAAVMIVVVYAPNLWIAVPAMVLTGATWLTVANTLAVSAQLSLPNWVRARAMSTYQMALMGGSAAGAALWGKIAGYSDLPTAIKLAAIVGVASMWFIRRRRLEDNAQEDLTPSRSFKAPAAGWQFDPHDGPVLTMVEYRIDPSRANEFIPIVEETGRRRLARGALAWELFRDTSDPGRFVEHIVDESWLEHLRHFDRLTAADELLRNRRHEFLLDRQPPQVTRSIAAHHTRNRPRFGF